MRTSISKALLLFLLVCMTPVSGFPAESGWNEVGARMGLQVSSKQYYFRQYEVFAVYGLPWDWRHSSGWGVTPQLNTSLGALVNKRESGFIGSLGTAIALDKKGTGLSTDLGINANFLDRRHFGGLDFGSILQFGAYLGINYRFDNGFKIGYRIQHISNGHLMYSPHTPNPGLDMHLIGISKVF